MTAPKKIVLAYSGGLDTSVILPWLKDRYPGVKLVAFAAELGQGDELKGIEDKAYKSGADEVVVKDLRKEFAEEYCFPMLRAHAIYEQDYLLGTCIARPLIAKHQVRGRAPDRRRRRRPRRHRQGQRPGPLRADLHGPRPDAEDHRAVEGPAVPRRRPRDRETRDRLRPEARHPDPASKKKIYSQDRNLWHISHEGAEIEDPAEEPNWEACLHDGRAAGEGAEQGRVSSRSTSRPATRSRSNGESFRGRGHELIAELNKIGGKHGVGQVTLVENRLVGMKSRGVYETPGGTILYEAHKALEQICLERDTLHYKQQVALQVRRAGLLRPVVPPAARGAADVHRSRQPGRHRQGEGASCTRAAPRRSSATSPHVALRHEARQLRDEGLRRHRGARLHRPVRPADEGARPASRAAATSATAAATTKAGAAASAR